MYTVIQSTPQNPLFGFINRKDIETVYTFITFIEALKFAAHEQISTFVFEKNGNKTVHRTYKYIYRLNKWAELANKNPLHYTGLRKPERLNLEKYYFILIDRNFNKLLKH